MFTVIGLSILGAAGYIFTKKMAEVSSFIIDTQTVFLKISEIESNAQKVMVKLSVHISAEEPASMNEISHEIIELSKRVSEEIYQFYTLLLSIDEQYVINQKNGISLELERFQGKWLQFQMVIRKILRLSSDYLKEDAYSLIITEGKKKFNKATSILHQRIENYRNKTAGFRNQIRDYQESSVRGILFITFFGIGLGVAINVWIIFSIMNLINIVVNNSEKVASGDTNVHIEVLRNDEMGKLLSAQKEMINSIQSVIDQANTISKGDYSVNVVPRSENDDLSLALNRMTQKLREMTQKNKEQDWIKTGQTELNDRMRGNRDAYELANSAATFIANYVNAQIGAIYLNNDKNTLKLFGSYAFKTPQNVDFQYKFGEGLIGQAATEMKSILFNELSFDQTDLIINSGFHECVPYSIYIVPLIYAEKVIGVMEFGKSMHFNEAEIILLDMISQSMAIAFNSSGERYRTKKLLEETKRQAEKLQKQKEELAKTSKALSLSSQYKSDFLANMSHELRSPLNSILLLSQSLADNKNGNLSHNQVQHAKTIHTSGKELLTLINDILDMTKIESGKEEIIITPYKLKELPFYVRQHFEHMAEQKKLILKTEMDENLPLSINTDQRRLEQIVKNFMSNAIKFTEKGTIEFKILRPLDQSELDNWQYSPDKTIKISVSDTGIGIPQDKQHIIFDAFQQADGSTSRKFGGTGLGLSISKKIATLLKGKITLNSQFGQGSTFSLYLPEILEPKENDIDSNDNEEEEEQISDLKNELVGQSANNTKNSEYLKNFLKDKVFLLIDDDMRNVYTLSHFFAERGVIVEQAFGAKEALKMLDDSRQIDLVLIDMMIPEMDVYDLIRIIRKQENVKNVPIIALMTKNIEKEKDKIIKAGASDCLLKPVDTFNLQSMIWRWIS